MTTLDLKMLELIELHFVDKLYTSSPLFGSTSIGAVYKNRGNKNRLERDIKFLNFHIGGKGICIILANVIFGQAIYALQVILKLFRAYYFIQ